jgi:energy-coupling factor transport system permease protein
MLAFFSITLFFCDTLVGITVFATLFIAVYFLSKLPVKAVFLSIWPIYFLVAITIIFNAFYLDQNGSFFNIWSFSFVGFMAGVIFAGRIMLCVWASMVFCLSTATAQITDAFLWFLAPFKKIGLPTDDIAMVASIAIRFMPLCIEEFSAIKQAQWARGADFNEGALLRRVKSWVSVLIPFFISMYRKADIIALSMDARGYGVFGTQRTSICDLALSLFSVVICCIFCAACVTFAIIF